MCSQLVPLLLIRLCVYSWLPLIYIGAAWHTNVAVGVALTNMAIILMFDTLVQGILIRVSLLYKASNRRSAFIIHRDIIRNNLNFDYFDGWMR